MHDGSAWVQCKARREGNSQWVDAKMQNAEDRFNGYRRARRLEINTGDGHKHENNGYMIQLIHDEQ